MDIEVEESLLHWNYFLALSDDLETVSRYIEFAKTNFGTYSIELAHLLLASASEVDVVLKGICKIIDPNSNPENINQYREIIIPVLPDICRLKALIPRFGISLTPWANWEQPKKNPDWWHSYNNVKHQRAEYYSEANLENVLNSLGGLMITNFVFYKYMYGNEYGIIDENKQITRRLVPESNLYKLEPQYYFRNALLP
jgi:hypothetical protein